MANEDMIQHILLPVPDIRNVPQPANKIERLETIISNLDKQHQHVRLSIIEAGKQRQAQNEDGAMDLDEPRGRRLPSSDASMEQMFEAMNTPYHESMGDLSSSSKGKLPNPPEGVRQATPPPEIQLARDVLDQIERYDRTAKPVRKFYSDALERERRRTSSTGGSGVWDRISGGYRGTGAPMNVSRDPRRVQASPREPPRVNASPIDASRDPRLRR